MQYVYPAIFTPEQVAGRGTVYTVEIPDILGCVTEGESIPTAIEMAREALVEDIRKGAVEGHRILAEIKRKK
jgi:Uncharacterised protein family (UPF0150).